MAKPKGNRVGPGSHVQSGRMTHTFVVRMVDGDDAGWSGVVTHVRSGRTQTFRGFIEAIRFMDGYMTRVEEDGDRPPGKSAVGHPGCH